MALPESGHFLTNEYMMIQLHLIFIRTEIFLK